MKLISHILSDLIIANSDVPSTKFIIKWWRVQYFCHDRYTFWKKIWMLSILPNNDTHRKSMTRTESAGFLWSESIWLPNDMVTRSALLALCGGNPLVTDRFPSQKVSNATLYVFFLVGPNNLVVLLMIWDAHVTPLKQSVRRTRSEHFPPQPMVLACISNI